MTQNDQAPDPGARVSRLLADDAVAADLGIEIVRTAPGEVVLRLTAGARWANGHGIVHGGLLFTLADSAFACAFATRADGGVTTTASISYLAPVAVGSEVEARATEVLYDGVTGIYDVVVSVSGIPVAAFRGQGRARR